MSNSNRKINNNKKKFSQVLKNILIGSTTTRKIFRLYFLVLIIFAGILYSPISFQAFLQEGFNGPIYNLHYIDNHYVMLINNKEITFDFFDCLFTSFSAFSDTGLSVIPIYSVFSNFGKVIMILLIQIGGFGIMFFIFVFWKIFNKKENISINQTLIAQSEKGNTKMGNTEKMLVSSAIFITIIEIIFGFAFTLWFYYVPGYEQFVPEGGHFLVDTNEYNQIYHNWSNAFLCGFFHSVSSINNAGFDVIGANSLAQYRNGINAIFLLLTIFMFVLGGIGFPIIYDILEKGKFSMVKVNNRKFSYYKIVRNKNKKHYLSLFTKLSITTYFIITCLSILFSFVFECTIAGGGTNLLWNDNTGAFGTGDDRLVYFNKSVQIIFQSMSTRSAGFATFNNLNLNPSTKWLDIVLMYIGGAPSSTAGGIRVTTFAIICLGIYARMFGKKNVHAFKRSIDNKTTVNSFIVAIVGIILISIGGVVLITTLPTAINNQDSFTNAMFISSSAFGTTGLSTVSINQIGWFAKLYLMFLMFIGQCGVSSTLLVFRRSNFKNSSYNYIYEDVKIG